LPHSPGVSLRSAASSSQEMHAGGSEQILKQGRL